MLSAGDHKKLLKVTTENCLDRLVISYNISNFELAFHRLRGFIPMEVNEKVGKIMMKVYGLTKNQIKSNKKNMIYQNYNL